MSLTAEALINYFVDNLRKHGRHVIIDRGDSTTIITSIFRDDFVRTFLVYEPHEQNWLDDISSKYDDLNSNGYINIVYPLEAFVRDYFEENFEL